MSSESTSSKVSNVLGDIKFLVSVVVGHTLFRGTNVYLIVLDTSGLLHNVGQDPCTRAQTSPLEEEGNDQKDVCDGVVQEGNGEGRCGQLPRDGGQDGGDDGSVETVVKEGLCTIRDTEDVVALTWRDVQSSDGSYQEE